MGFLARMSRAIAALFPSSRPAVAKRKRRLERELRARGLSRAEAMAEASRRKRDESAR